MVTWSTADTSSNHYLVANDVGVLTSTQVRITVRARYRAQNAPPDARTIVWVSYNLGGKLLEALVPALTHSLLTSKDENDWFYFYTFDFIVPANDKIKAIRLYFPNDATWFYTQGALYVFSEGAWRVNS